MHSTGVETWGLWCVSDGISCMLGSVHVMSLFRVCLLFPRKHLTCTDPENCLWEGKGLSSKCLSKEMHKKSSSCKNVAFLFEAVRKRSKTQLCMACSFFLSCYSSLWFHDLISPPGYFFWIGLYRWLPLSMQQST